MANKHLKKKTAPSETPAKQAQPKPVKEKKLRRAAAKAAPQPAEDAASQPIDFQKEPTEEARSKRAILSRRDVRGAVAAIAAALILFAATVIIWLYRSSFNTDDLILSTSTAAVAEEEYIFDAGAGQVFAAAGKGLAIATSSGLELLDDTGTVVTSKLMQMETPAIAACASFAVFYDLGGTNITVAFFDGTVQELTVQGNIFSATVSENGYLAVTTECTGYRAVVTVYDPQLEVVYEWYSSSAWVLSACVSPDNRKMAVLSYTSGGSEVRLFDLSQTEQLAAFSVSDTVLLDVCWFSSSLLCAISSEQAFFFGSDGIWTDTYSFSGQYLIDYTFDGDGYAAFALSPYLAGTTATLVTLDSVGRELGTAEIQSELICLSASESEILALCSDGALLYNSSLEEKGQLTGLPGFKYGILRNRGEALLVTSNYAEVYKF